MKRLQVVPAIMLVLAMTCLSCSEWVSSVEPLTDEVDDSLLTSEKEVPFVLAGVQGRWASYYSVMTRVAGLISDELFWETNVPNTGNAIWGEWNGNVPFLLTRTGTFEWDAAGETRFFADDLVRRVGEIDFVDKNLEKEALFWGYFIGGFARFSYAAWWGLTQTEGGGVITDDLDKPGEFIPSQEMYGLALEKLALALGHADAYQAKVVHSLMARIHLFRQDYASAATEAGAGLIEGDPPFQALFSAAGFWNNWWVFAGGANKTNPVDFRFRDYHIGDAAEAARIPLIVAKGGDGVTDYYFQAIVTRRDDPLDVITWQEMALILAEIALRNNDTGAALRHINQVRAAHGLADKSAADLNTDILGILGLNLIVEERDKELIMHGMRLVDQRRFDIWHRPGGWQYALIPINERERNPNIPDFP